MDVTFPTGETYILAIDTDSYSGNFERELAGYCAGAFDERAHGKREAALFDEATGEIGAAIKAKLRLVHHNEYGDVHVTIRATPGRLNNGMGFHYDAGGAQEAEARAKSVEAMRDFQAPQIAMCEKRLAEEDFEPASKPGAWTKEACERTLRSAHESIARAGERIGFPAYESVAIFFYKPLTDEELALVTTRAHEYAKTAKKLTPYRSNFKIRDIYMVRATQAKVVEDRL